MKIRSLLWPRILISITFLISVNLLAGYIATKFNYASLYNVRASFGEYAIPLPFCWGLAHWPSMLLYGIPLLFLPGCHEKYTKYFRLACATTFLLLLLEFDKKIPFLLFPKVDAVAAFICSLVISPPNRKNNPLLVMALSLVAILSVLSLTFFTYSTWKHRTPIITNTEYGKGVFELTSITVRSDFHKEMVFEVNQKVYLPEDQACAQAQSLAGDLLKDYPFDSGYNKIITVTFNPTKKTPNFNTYSLGEISLNNEHREKDGRFACYLKYKDNTER